MAVFFVPCIIALVASLPLTLSQGPSEITSDVNRQIMARVGDTVRLQCPVESRPMPLFTWSKDGESIHQGWDRVRETERGLRIKNVEIEDSGTYRCRASNGFGSLDIEFVVFVSPDGNSTGATLPHDQDQSGEPPRFTHPEDLERYLRRPAGQNLRLPCQAAGHPRPAILWFFNGVTVSGNDLDVYTDPDDRMSLRVDNLQPRHAGNYVCRVFNHLGRKNHTFTLTVSETRNTKPELVEPYPANTTVSYGMVAKFQCRIQSSDPPNIQWLKQVDEHTAARNQSATIPVQGKHYMVVNGEKAWQQSEGVYTSQLRITGATLQDAGEYVCFSANGMGFSYQGAHLTVLAPANLPGESGLSLYIIVGIAAGAIVLVTIIIICVIKRNADNKRKPPAASSIVRSPHHVPSDKHSNNCDYSSLYNTTANSTPSGGKTTYSHSDGHHSGHSEVSQKLMPHGAPMHIMPTSHSPSMTANMMAQQHGLGGGPPPQQQYYNPPGHMMHPPPPAHMAQYGPPGQPSGIYPQLQVHHQHHHIQHYDA